MLGDAQETALRPWLLPGERLLWSGRPVQGLRFERRDLYLVPISLVWGGFAIFWNVAVWSSGAPSLFLLWGLPFLAVGFYVVVGRFLQDALQRRLTVYGVSNRRILILRRSPFTRLRAFEFGYLPLLEYEQHRGGRGTIRFDFDESEPWWSNDLGRWFPRGTSAGCFDRIDEPRRVYDLIVRETERWRREQYGPDSAHRSFIG